MDYYCTQQETDDIHKVRRSIRRSSDQTSSRGFDFQINPATFTHRGVDLEHFPRYPISPVATVAYIRSQMRMPSETSNDDNRPTAASARSYGDNAKRVVSYDIQPATYQRKTSRRDHGGLMERKQDTTQNGNARPKTNPALQAPHPSTPNVTHATTQLGVPLDAARRKSSDELSAADNRRMTNAASSHDKRNLKRKMADNGIAVENRELTQNNNPKYRHQWLDSDNRIFPNQRESDIMVQRKEQDNKSRQWEASVFQGQVSDDKPDTLRPRPGQKNRRPGTREIIISSQQCSDMDDRPSSTRTVKTMASVTSLDSGAALTSSNLNFTTSTPLEKSKSSGGYDPGLKVDMTSTPLPVPTRNSHTSCNEAHKSTISNPAAASLHDPSFGVGSRTRSVYSKVTFDTKEISTESKGIDPETRKEIQGLSPVVQCLPLREPALKVTPSFGVKTQPLTLPRSAPGGNMQGRKLHNSAGLFERGEFILSEGPDPPKSAPSSNRAASHTSRKGLRPVNLFPERTQPSRSKHHCIHASGVATKQEEAGLLRERTDENEKKPSLTAFSFASTGNKVEPVQKSGFPRPTSQPLRQFEKGSCTTQEVHIHSSGPQGEAVSGDGRKRQYWFHENTIRRLSAIEPGMFHVKETRTRDKRRSTIGVRQAKSVDIAAIYSQQYSRSRPASTSFNTNKSVRCNDRQQVFSNFKSIHNPNNKNPQNSSDNISKPPNLRPNAAFDSQHSERTFPPATSRIAINDHGIPDEEFRSADLFLKDLDSTMGGAKNSLGSPSVAPLWELSSKTTRPSDRLAMSNSKNSEKIAKSAVRKMSLRLETIHSSDRRDPPHLLPASTTHHTANRNGKMTQDQIRDHMERKRIRAKTRQSLPEQRGSEKPTSREIYCELFHHHHGLYATAEDTGDARRASNKEYVTEMSTPKVDSAEQNRSRNFKSNLFHGGGGDSLSKDFTSGSASHGIGPLTSNFNSNETFFRRLDEAVSRRHTIHFANFQAGATGRLSRPPSVDTLSSGYRSLERNGRTHAQLQCQSGTGQLRSPRLPRERQQNILAHSGKSIQKTASDRIDSENPSIPELPARNAEISEAVSKRALTQIMSIIKPPFKGTESSQAGKALGLDKSTDTKRQPSSQRLKASLTETTKLKMHTHSDDGSAAPKSFQEAMYRPVPGPNQFLARMRDGLQEHQTVDSAPSSTHWTTTPSPAPLRRQTIAGVSALHDLKDLKMDKRKGSPGRKRNVFKGSVLVSLLVESHPERFPTRTAAVRLAGQLLKQGHIRSIFGASDFEDSAQLYVWDDGDVRRRAGGHLGGSRNNNIMTSPTSSSCSNPALPSSRSEARDYDKTHKGEATVDWRLIEDVRNKVVNRSETYNIVTSYNTFFQELERDFGFDHKTHTHSNSLLAGSDAGWGPLSGRTGTTPYTSTLELKKQSSGNQTSPDTQKAVSKETGAKKVAGEATSTQRTPHPHFPESSSSQDPGHAHTGRNVPKQSAVISPRVGKDHATRRGHFPSRDAHPSKETYSTRSSAQPHANIFPLSLESNCSPPSAAVKPRQHHDHKDYRHHQYQNQRSLKATSENSLSQQPNTSNPNPDRSAHSSSTTRDYKKSQKMDANVAAHFQTTKPYAKDFNSGSLGYHGQLNSQPSTLESGIGSSHPDTTANSVTTSSHPQPFSLGRSENPDAQYYHRGHFHEGPTPHHHHHHHHHLHQYSKENDFSAHDSHHEKKNNSSSPPEIPKWPDCITSAGSHKNHPAFRGEFSQGTKSLSADQYADAGGNDIGSPGSRGGGGTAETRVLETNDPASSLIKHHGDTNSHSAGGGGLSPPHLAVGDDDGGIGHARRGWTTSDAGAVHNMADGNYSYSDNEKQLLEEMRRMKQEHQSVLKTYEGRVNKLMAKMHELRNIAEMLENSSSKPLPGKLALLDILAEDRDLPEKAVEVDAAATISPPSTAAASAAVTTNMMMPNTAADTPMVPPPLPPRPSRGSRVYPNKPIIYTTVQMRPLAWSRIILDDEGAESPGGTVWHGMKEPALDTEELERLFSGDSERSSDVNLYDDVCLRRGRAKTQLVSIYDSERSQRIVSELRALPCTLPEVIQAFVTLNSSDLHTDSFAELLELLTSARELDKILHHVKRKGAGQLEAPEYLVSELSKVDHFRERLEFLRFQNKLQINLFEIDQQLRELNTACEEITSSLSLKNVLETVLAVGNHMNAGSELGQADGFRVDVLNSLKDIQDTVKRGNLLELIMRVYCLKYESSMELGCPTRFRLPEPSNMRHAAQVSFQDIQRALKELKEELAFVRGKLEALSMKEGNTVTIALRVTSENFMTSAVEVLAEEQKLLETTRVHFWKTAAYFCQDGQKSSPREFFQIWASFLHDCKYYWKLAHRNLARDKFTSDLSTKSQLSSSSLPEFNSLKSAMMRHVTTFSQDAEMRESRARQLEHINSWIESVGRYTMEMMPAEDMENFNDESHYPPPPLPPPPVPAPPSASQPEYPHDGHHHHHHSHRQHPYHAFDRQENDASAMDSEMAEDRDCPTPVNLPENNLYSEQFTQHQHQSRQQATDSRHHQSAEPHRAEEDVYSPYYKNQPRPTQGLSGSSKGELYNHSQYHSSFSQPLKSFGDGGGAGGGEGFSQVQTSPKPIKAIPPNVIKPQPITQTSPTVSSPSPVTQHHHTIQLAQPLPRVDTNNNSSGKKYDSGSNNKMSRSNRNNKHSRPHPAVDAMKSHDFPEEDNFGFEPLYESLFRHAFRQAASPPSYGSETPPPYTDNDYGRENDHHPLHPYDSQPQDHNVNEIISSPGPTDLENSNKKNGNFFKSLLKRDSKPRTPSGSTEPQSPNPQQGGNQHSALRSVSAPFNKFRNTVVQKFSGGSNAKKPHTENPKSPPASHGTNSSSTKKYNELSDGLEESPPKPARGFPVDQAQEWHREDSLNSNKTFNSSTNAVRDDAVNYQNYFYPGQPRRAEVAASHEHRPKKGQDEGGFEEHRTNSSRPAAVMLVTSGPRDGHDSLPSTVSSRHSGRDHGLSMYRETNSNFESKDKSRRRDRSADRLEEQPRNSHSHPEHHQGNGERDARSVGHGRSDANSGRIRAPIALGSNISISDMYGKAMEAASQVSDGEDTIAEGCYTENEGNQALLSVGSYQLYQASSSRNKREKDFPKSVTAEQKWVKTTAVPVYKAKLIPNYENQTKYDPKLEGGVRGHADPVTSPLPYHARHAPQASNTSDMYRQELQKKSGQYVVGSGGSVIYQDPSVTSGSKSRSNAGHAVVSSVATSVFPGAPTSYTVLPPKFTSSHYHASPVILSQHQGNPSQHHQSQNPGHNPTGSSNANIYQRSSSSPPPSAQEDQYHGGSGDGVSTESHHIKSVAASMFTVSPDGRLELGPPRDVHSAEGGLTTAQKIQHQNRRVVARRSSSANNILDRAAKSPSGGQGKRRRHAVDDNTCIRDSRYQQYNKETASEDFSSQGHVSRRDNTAKKTTPTSYRQPSAPRSIMSLIDRFEQSPPPNALLASSSSPSSNLLHPPLTEDDKPPSMTSTPLARRKHTREDGRVASPPVSSGRSDDASTHSHSTGSKKSSGRHHGDHQKPHHQRHHGETPASSDKKHHRHHHRQDHQGDHMLKKNESGHRNETAKRSGSYPQAAHQQGWPNQDQEHTAYPGERGSGVPSSHQQNTNHCETGSSSSSSHHHNHRHHQQANKNGKDTLPSFSSHKFENDFMPSHHAFDSKHLAGSRDRRKDDGREIRSSSQGAGGSHDKMRGGGRPDERLTYSSQSHRPGHYHATPPASSGSSHNSGSAYHSSFLPKPEPQYPGLQSQQQNYHHSKNGSSIRVSSNDNNGNNGSSHQNTPDKNSTHHAHEPRHGSQLIQAQDQQNYPKSQSPASSSSSNIINSNNNNFVNINPTSTSHSQSHHVQQVHRRQSPQIHYISPLANRQTFSSNLKIGNISNTNNSSSNSSNNNNNNNITTTTTSHNSNTAETQVGSSTQADLCGNDLYTAEFRRAIKSSNSAFDRPLKSGPPYGRQPGAMAVVKPTVVHT